LLTTRNSLITDGYVPTDNYPSVKFIFRRILMIYLPTKRSVRNGLYELGFLFTDERIRL